MKFVQLNSLRDLVMFVAFSPMNKVIQHIELEGSHLYFLIGGNLTELFLYLVKTEESFTGGYITHNHYTGEIGSSEKLVSEPSIDSFPVVEIKNQDLFPKDLIETLNRL
jgi:hypothetical protein